MNFLQIGNRVINLAHVTDVSHSVVERNNIPHLEVVVSFSADNFITFVDEHAMVAWQFFTALGFSVLHQVQVAP